MSAGASVSLSGSVAALLSREARRAVRQPARFVGTLAAPIILWLVLGAGLSRLGGVGDADGTLGYGAFLLPGIASMAVLFTAIFASISLIEDRQAGFLRAVLVGPVALPAVVIAKVVATTVLAMAQGALIIAAAPMVGLEAGVLDLVFAVVLLGAIAAGMSGVSLAFAWRVESSQAYHSVMNLVLMPLWLLSGSVFSQDTAAGWMGWVVRLNPLSYPTAALRDTLAGVGASPGDLLGSALVAAGGVVLPLLVAPRRAGG